VSPFQRTLTEDEATDLATILSRVFTRKIGAADVFTVVDLVNRFEHRMTGRIAGDVQDYVLNYFMVTTAAEREPTIERAHVEIGVLFGGGLLLSAHALMSIGSRNRIIGIDPLSGYYGNRRDPVTGLRVRASTVHQNFHRVGLDAQRYELIVARSDDRAASEALAGVELASVWIDGDHSYQGVRSDWLTYSPLVCRGGFVLFDNYGDGVFPDIDRFIEDELLPDLEGWEVVIHLGRSILLRKL
jgi:cephalosporin hydroxylase